MILKRFFPLFTTRRKQCFRLAASVGLTLLSPAQGANQLALPSATQQIDTAVTQAARSEIGDMAAAQRWGKVKMQTEAVIPPDASALPPCTAPLNAKSGGGTKRTLLRLRYEVSCPDNGGWTLTVAVKTSVNVPLVTSAHTLERGRVIGPEDVVMREQNISLMQEQVFTDPQQVTGQTLKRRLNAGQPLSASVLDQPVLISRGQGVTLVINHQGIEARTAGEALKQGRKGEMIRVRNSSSQRIVDGIVESAGIVRVVGVE